MTIYNYITIRYKTLLILWISIIYALTSPAGAQNQFNTANREASIYTIYNMKIDETAGNVSTARDRALMNGQRQALERLFRRIILISDRDKLPQFSNAEVTDFVSGFEVNNERRSTVRYIASLVVHFNREKVNGILSQYQIPYAETLGTAVSILPVLEEGGALMLWERNNKWRQAWEKYDVINNLVPISTPEPSLRNRMYISALQAKTNDENSIKAFIEQNTLNDLIIATATVHKSPDRENLVLDIHLKRNNATGDDDVISEKQISVTAPANDQNGEPNLEELFRVGVDTATDWVDDLWKSKVLVNYGTETKIIARGPLRQVNDWVIIKKQIEKVNLIKNVNLKSLTIDNVNLEIEFSGDTDQLALSLAQQGLTLEQNQASSQWTIGLTDLAIRESRIQ